MAKFDATYRELMALRDDIARQQQLSPAFFFFTQERVKKFLSENAMHLNILKSRMDEHIKKYVKHDENAQPVTEQQNGSTHYVFENDEAKQAYLEANKKFLSLKITFTV